MQNYSKFQKFISFVLIFSILFSFTIHVSFFQFVAQIFAGEAGKYHVVALFVQQEIYDDLASDIKQYATNIQNSLENTRTIIIPTPSKENPYNIASLSEKLYFDGYHDLIKGSPIESGLVGSVFIGDLALPVVENAGYFEKTILPYVDFEDKMYIYDSQKKIYGVNSNFYDQPKAEIWHGFISPNTGDSAKDIEKIHSYFTKNNHFYQGTGPFTGSGVLDGKDGHGAPEGYEPYVFYFDQLRESKGVNYASYRGYQIYTKHLEEISRGEYSQELAQEIRDLYLESQSQYLGSGSVQSTSLSSVPDIQLKTIINKTLKKFVEIFGEGTLGEMRKDVYNAGRYNFDKDHVNVHYIPYLVSLMDIWSAGVVREMNTKLENSIDATINNGIARSIAVPTKIIKEDIDTQSEYLNFYAGLQGSLVSSPYDCTIYRGSTEFGGTLVQGNRGFNVSLLDADYKTCSDTKTQGYWGGNSPLNLDASSLQTLNRRLNSTANLDKAVVKVFDIQGGVKSLDPTKIPSPLNCYRSNFILTRESDDFGEDYQVPINGRIARDWNCSTINKNFSDHTFTFEKAYKDLSSAPGCQGDKKLYLDTLRVKSLNSKIDPLDEEVCDVEYYFKKIPSVMSHVSPTGYESSSQQNAAFTPALPLDKEHYVDFIASDGQYVKLLYPRISSDLSKDEVKARFDAFSKALNEVIIAHNPNKLSGTDKTIYQLLKRGEYPAPTVNASTFLSGQDNVLLGGALNWITMESVSEKYKYILDHYLSFAPEDSILPRHRDSYEIAYIAAPGSSNGESMYVKLDPEEKNTTNPYADIITDNVEIDNYLLNVSDETEEDEDEFKCSPPEGVPIRKWLPAVICRLKDMLPPTISVSESNCSDSTLFLDDDGDDGDGDYTSFYSDYYGSSDGEGAETKTIYSGSDANKNGIDDRLESDLKGEIAGISLTTSSTQYPYKTSGSVEATLVNNSNQPISYDANTYVEFSVAKVEAYTQDGTKKTIYDTNQIEGGALNGSKARAEAQKYIAFGDTLTTRMTNGKAKYVFSTKSNKADVTIQAKFTLKDNAQEIIKSTQKVALIAIRGDVLRLSSYQLATVQDRLVLNGGVTNVEASSEMNAFLTSESFLSSKRQDLPSLGGLSPASQKIFLSLSMKDESGAFVSPAYPIKVTILKDGKMIKEPTPYASGEKFINLGALKDIGTYEVSIEDRNNRVVTKEIMVTGGEAVKLIPKLSTNLMEAGGVITTHAFIVADAYGNPSSGKYNQVTLDIDGDGVTFEDGKTQKTMSVFDGFGTFRLKTTKSTQDNILKFTLKAQGSNKKITLSSSNIQVVDKIDFSITLDTTEALQLNKEYTYTLSLTTLPNEKTSFNSRSYLVVDQNYLKSKESFITIKNNSGKGSFSTKTKAGRHIALAFQIEGVKNPVYKYIDINAGVPMKLSMQLSKSQIEARRGSQSVLSVQLIDRYGNKVTQDSTTNLTLSIDKKYQKFLGVDATTKTVNQGKATFSLLATDIPGLAYFKVTASPSLANNSFFIKGQTPFPKSQLTLAGMTQGGKLTALGSKFFEEYDQSQFRMKFAEESGLLSNQDYRDQGISMQQQLLAFYRAHDSIEVKGVSENAGKIETFYFWNEKSITGNKYNALYTTLIGSNYGDITKGNSLGNAMIFDGDNRSLAVTSLLTTGERHYDVLEVRPNGNISINAIADDLSQDIEPQVTIDEAGELQVSFYNQTFGSLVANSYYHLKNPKLIPCKEAELGNCYDPAYPSLALQSKSSAYRVNLHEMVNLEMVDADGNKIIEVDKQTGRISKAPFVKLLLNTKTTDSGVFDLSLNGSIIGQLGIHFVGSSVKITRDVSTISELKATQTWGGVVVYLESMKYYSKTLYASSSTKGVQGITIAYDDPFSASNTKLGKFSTFFDAGYETFDSNRGLGWSGNNKTLLSFAGGKSVGESTQDYQSFALINLGDPVLRLKPIQKTLPGNDQQLRKYDKTIGRMVSSDDKNIAYGNFDYNNDQKEDLALLKIDGYIEILEGNGTIGDYTSRGNVVYFPDLGEDSTMDAGDFTGDGFGDVMVMTDNKQLTLINNHKKDFTRIDSSGLKDEQGQVIFSGSTIQQLISLDMDLDGKSDLVTLDENGDIFVYYGTSTPGVFSKKFIANYGVSLSSKVRNDGGAVYFDGLYQIPEDASLVNTENYSVKNLSDYKNQFGNGVNENNDALVDKLIFTKLTYDPDLSTAKKGKDSLLDAYPDSIMTDDMKSGTNGTDSEINDVESGIQDTITGMNELSEYLETNNSGVDPYSSVNSTKTTTFIKSQYSRFEGLEVKKSFIDSNGGTLKGGDTIELHITLTNSGNTTKSRIAYADKIPDNFVITSAPDVRMTFGGTTYTGSQIDLVGVTGADYTYLFDHVLVNDTKYPLTLAPGETLDFSITLTTLDFSVGYIEADYLEDTTPHGDIAFKRSRENCGQDYYLYKSIASRSYQSEKKTPVCENKMPTEYTDKDKNGTPDYIDEILKNPTSDSVREQSLKWYDEILDNDSSTYDNLEEELENIDEILDGLSCGFGGGGCISTPLNRAPLAPGNDPTLFGIPAGDGLWVGEGLPIFAAPTKCSEGWGTRPPCPLGAGGRLDGIKTGLGISQFRIFVTPTITGAIGVAMCFGSNVVAGWTPIPGLSPYIPGGNCIIAAVPLIGCENDGSDGEIENMGIEGSSLVYGNCSQGQNDTTDTPYLGDSLANEYLNYKKTGQKSTTLSDRITESLSKVADSGEKWETPNDPLISVDAGGSTPAGGLSLSIDWGSVKNGNFEDVVQVEMERISGFPDFIMDWVTRQIEEFVTKLTDFPTLYIILPQFEGVFDGGWQDFTQNLTDAFESGKQEALQEQATINAQIDSINASQDTASGSQSAINTLAINRLRAQKALDSNTTVSGIKEAYAFLSNLPLIDIVPEKVQVNLPWIDDTTLEKAILDFETTRDQWEAEISQAKDSRNLNNYNCVENDTNAGCHIILDADELLSSLDRNIEILKEYKNIPSEIYKMLKIKEIRLEQILCNLETISDLLGGRIGDNGKRFKAWVELYVLIKAILKSWQLLVDVFIDFDAECHECKNERRDLMYFIWKLIDIIMPEIPVIQFPKWPDIYLDLHNIRVGLKIAIPEFEFNLRPILLPNLPSLFLPEAPDVTVTLPDLPLLPEIELPELPDLPSLPVVELPDLPPPPKLPKLFSSIEAFLKILKLITKAMCLLKSNPLVPEWRAGDQIAFITERTGYLDLDWLDVSLPQFSFPFIDAIKVTTRVNLEYEAEFLVEMARQAVLPINTFTSNVVNMFDIGVDDLDFSDVGPKDVEIEIKRDGSVDVETSSLPTKHSTTLYELAFLIAHHIATLQHSIQSQSSELLTGEEFKQRLKKELASPAWLETPKTQAIAKVLKGAVEYDMTEEDAFIKELKANKEAKFEKLRDLLKQEQHETLTMKHQMFGESDVKYDSSDLCVINPKVEVNKYLPQDIELLSAPVSDGNKSVYRSLFDASNSHTLEKYSAMLHPDTTAQKQAQDLGKSIVDSVHQGAEYFEKKMQQSESAVTALAQKTNHERSRKELAFQAPSGLASSLVTTTAPILSLQSNSTSAQDTYSAGNQFKTSREPTSYTTNPGSCLNDSAYEYTYEGMYVIEKDTKTNKDSSYHLFDYLDELKGDEKFIETDVDEDGDEDIIYMAGTEIFIKHNLMNHANRTHYSGSPVIYGLDDNVYFEDAPKFLDGVNGFTQGTNDNGFLNILFGQPLNAKIANFSLEFFTIIDKFADESNGFVDGYVPAGIKKHSIDAFRDIELITKIDPLDDKGIDVHQNLANIGDLSANLAGVKMKARKIHNLKNDVELYPEVIINAKTFLYTGKNSVKMEYFYYEDKHKEVKSKKLTIPSYSNIQFPKDAVVSSLSHPVYVVKDGFVWYNANEIIAHRDEPILPGTIITSNSIELEVHPFIEIRYYDGTKQIIDSDDTKYYELYDLGNYASSYLLRTSLVNDFYYAKIRSFRAGIFSPHSNQIVFSPQKASDTRAPEISAFKIEVPVYQQKTANITNFVYEDSGNQYIKDVSIDFDLTKDSDGDGDKANDRDYFLQKTFSNTTNAIQIQAEKTYDGLNISLKIGPYDSVMSKKIRVRMEDENANRGFHDVQFTVYGPGLKIQSIQTVKKANVHHIVGTLDEDLVNEPVRFYRIRGQSIDKLFDGTKKDKTLSVDGGKFAFNVPSTGSGLAITYTGDGEPMTLATIDEETGKISKGINSAMIRVYPSGYKDLYTYPVAILSYQGKDLYYQYLVTPNAQWVNVVDHFQPVLESDDPNKVGVYYRPISSKYSVYQIPHAVSFNGGDVFLYDPQDASKSPIAKIFKDGRIVLPETFILRYSSYGNYVVYQIVEKGVVIGEVMIIPEANYVMK